MILSLFAKFAIKFWPKVIANRQFLYSLNLTNETPRLTLKDLNPHMIICIVDNQPEIDGIRKYRKYVYSY